MGFSGVESGTKSRSGSWLTPPLTVPSPYEKGGGLAEGDQTSCKRSTPSLGRRLTNPTRSDSGLFEARQRSLSLSDCSSSVLQLEHERNLITLQPSPLQNEATNPADTYVGQNNTIEKQMGARTNQEWQRDRVPKIPVHNRFEILNDDGPIIENKNKEYTPKPEPIFVTGVVDVTPLRNLLNKVAGATTFTMTTLRSGHIIKLMPTDIETYKAIRDNLIDNSINHYTYKLKSERAYRVVIRGLHATEDTTMIKAELNSKGHEGKHPASYKGCIKYMQYKEKIFKTEPKSRQTKQQLHKATQQQQSINENAKPTPRPSTTYSDILKNRQNNFKKQPINATIAEPGPQDNITSLLYAMFNKFQAIMKDIIDNMMDQMIKLITRLAPQRD
ncbi:Nucleic-acid-binding protein from transposon X-element [Eumeta japonica]|uniref:Nucleic-acid-binding protein from transposon X-element n=1 Tax=Eumeta variegata TaxID=151549 RepID=A0A4C1WHJ9_EUMVA|nr:Nucleic-acid-binding protein from transposon X-element [Eumeta japonica]